MSWQPNDYDFPDFTWRFFFHILIFFIGVLVLACGGRFAVDLMIELMFENPRPIGDKPIHTQQLEK